MKIERDQDEQKHKKARETCDLPPTKGTLVFPSQQIAHPTKNKKKTQKGKGETKGIERKRKPDGRKIHQKIKGLEQRLERKKKHKRT